MNINLQEGFFNAKDGKSLHYRLYRRPYPAGVLIVLHGHGEHIGRYEKFPARLDEMNLSIATYDARGHGQSAGFRAHADSIDDYVSDLRVFVDFLQKETGQKKFILLGHSVGGLVAFLSVLRFPEFFDGLILSSPCLKLSLPPFVAAFNRFVSRIAPRFLYVNPVIPPFLSHDKEEVEKYKNDPMILRKISARLVNEFLRAGEYLESHNEYLIPMPVFMILAEIEKVVDNSSMDKFYSKIRSPIKDRQIMSGMFHETFNEVDQQKSFEQLKKYLHLILRAA